MIFVIIANPISNVEYAIKTLEALFGNDFRTNKKRVSLYYDYIQTLTLIINIRKNS
jgi:hypothetical protein